MYDVFAPLWLPQCLYTTNLIIFISFIIGFMQITTVCVQHSGVWVQINCLTEVHSDSAIDVSQVPSLRRPFCAFMSC